MSFSVGIVARAAMMLGAAVWITACGGSNAVPTTPSSLASTATSTPVTPTWSLAGAVVNAADGTPIPGVTLSLAQLATTANRIEGRQMISAPSKAAAARTA